MYLALMSDTQSTSPGAPGLALRLSTAVGARLVCEGRVRPLSINDVIDISEERLTIHQGCGRRPPAGVAVGARRLELDHATVTWGVRSGHCRVWRYGDSSFVEDMSSDNGTHVHRDGHWRHMTPGIPAVLEVGDELSVGRIRFSVVAA
ncbi:FHA domain-containing protein [Sorangium sp. So ce834]|uniref:FHA domain-containing protein n=1 Tax=Sorangium sp. So ce834 TaxID=3133321 RepID=UPI003F61CD45